jgi:hypothetical protein
MAEKTNGDTAVAPQAVASKMEGVRQALRALGYDAKPLQIQTYLKKHFPIEMTADKISNYKSDIRKKRKGKGKAAKNDAAAPIPAPAATGSRKTAAAIDLGDIIQTVKTLVGRVGASGLKSLIDVLAK